MTNEELEGRSVGGDEAYTGESQAQNSPQLSQGRSVGTDAAYVPESQKGPQFAEGFTPTMSQSEYIQKLGKSGYSGRQITTIMSDVGYDEKSVRDEIMTNYERERKAYLEAQKKAREEAEARREQLEEERKKREEFFIYEKKKMENWIQSLGNPSYVVQTRRSGMRSTQSLQQKKAARLSLKKKYAQA